MLKFAYFIGAALLLSAPVPAQTTQSQPAQADSKESDVNRVVCRRKQELGSRLGAKKVCLTVQQWEELEQANREHTEDIQRSSGFRSGS